MSQFNPQSPIQIIALIPTRQARRRSLRWGSNLATGSPCHKLLYRVIKVGGVASPNAEDTGSFGWAVLGFFIPIAGLVLWLVWKNTKPKTATQCRNGFIAGLVLTVAFYIFSFAIIGSLSSGI